MDKFYKNCDCGKWKDNCNIIDSAIIMYGLRGGEKLKDSFEYCPWCCKFLEQEASE
jgi:hypothetical protein